MTIKLKENRTFIQVILQLIIKLMENGKFNHQCQLSLYLLRILMKVVLCTQGVIIVIMMGNETDKIIEELFESHLQKYQERLVKKLQEVNLSLISLIYCIIIFIK